MHCEALDEVHKMKINKEAKGMIVRPTDDNMHRLSNSLPFMARMAATFTKELFPERHIRWIRGRLWSIVGDATATTVATALAPVDLNQRDETIEMPDTMGSRFESLLLVSDGGSRPRLLVRLQPDYSEEARKAKHNGTMLLVAEVWEDGLDQWAIKAIKK